MTAPHASESKPASDEIRPKPGMKSERPHENGGPVRAERREKIETAPARSEKNQPTSPAKAKSEEKVERPDKPHAAESKPAPDEVKPKPGMKSEPPHENGGPVRTERREKIEAAPERPEKIQPTSPAKAKSEEKDKVERPKENDKEKAKPKPQEGHEKPSEKDKKEKEKKEKEKDEERPKPPERPDSH